jgi:hypothetical protein
MVLRTAGRPYVRAWEDHVKHFHPDLSDKMLTEGLHEHCMARDTSKAIKRARSLKEVWLLLEAHFDRQTAFIDGLVSQLLSSERAMNDSQILSYYNKVLRAIREAKELERLQDFLTPNQIETLFTVLPSMEVNYWRMEQIDVSAEDMPVEFYFFAGGELRNCAQMPLREDHPRGNLAQATAWEGPCVLGDLCKENHMPEVCSMFEELSPRDRLAVIQRKQLCHFCFWHSDSQLCPSHSMPACPV